MARISRVDARFSDSRIIVAIKRTVGKALNSSGLLLLTTDGELAHRLMHPSFGMEREYLVRVLGRAGARTLQRLAAGVMLEDGVARFDSVTEQESSGANCWYRVSLSEGRNRIVRRLWSSQGHAVSLLIRVRYGPVRLPRVLPRGKWREIDAKKLTSARE